MTSYECWSLVIQAAAVLVGTVVCVIYYGQLKAMRKSVEKSAIAADAAKESAVAAKTNANMLVKMERAWMSLSEMHIDVAAGQSTSIGVIALNSGKTPALHVKIVAVCQWGPQGTTKPNFTVYTVDNANTECMVGPNCTTMVELNEPVFSPIDANKLQTGELTLFLFGTIYYDDIFGVNHSTDYCGRFRWKGKAAFEHWPEHNNAT